MMVPPEAEALPAWIQNVLGGLAFLGVIGAMVVRFLGGKKDGNSDDHKTVVLEQAETADLSVIRRLIGELEPLPDTLDEIKRVISNQDRNYGLLERFNASLERVNARLDSVADNQNRIIAGIDRVVSQIDPAMNSQREILETLRRQDRAIEMKEAIEQAFRRTQAAPINADRK